MVKKEALRVSRMKRRAELSESERTLASLKICQRLFDEIDWKKIKRINAYVALSTLGEVDPEPLLSRLKVEFPKIKIVVSPFRVDAEHPPGNFDIVLVPLVGFDSHCNRIGMGGGWYDGYFAAHPNSLKIGLAYSLQKVNEIPISPIDVPMDMIVTEKAVFRR